MKFKKLNESAVVATELSNKDFSSLLEIVRKLYEEVDFINSDTEHETKLITYNDVSYYADSLQKLVDELKQMYSSWTVDKHITYGR